MIRPNRGNAILAVMVAASLVATLAMSVPSITSFIDKQRSRTRVKAMMHQMERRVRLVSRRDSIWSTQYTDPNKCQNMGGGTQRFLCRLNNVASFTTGFNIAVPNCGGGDSCTVGVQNVCETGFGSTVPTCTGAVPLNVSSPWQEESYRVFVGVADASGSRMGELHFDIPYKVRRRDTTVACSFPTPFFDGLNADGTANCAGFDIVEVSIGGARNNQGPAQLPPYNMDCQAGYILTGVDYGTREYNCQQLTTAASSGSDVQAGIGTFFAPIGFFYWNPDGSIEVEGSVQTANPYCYLAPGFGTPLPASQCPYR